jgi:hypothetical protein
LPRLSWANQSVVCSSSFRPCVAMSVTLAAVMPVKTR